MTQARRTLTRGGISIAVAIALAFGLAACGGDSPEALVASAKRYLDRRDYNAAAIELKNALQKKPQDGEARYLLGTVLVELRDFQSAEKELQRAVEFGFAPDKSLPALAAVMLELGRADKVVADFTAKDLADATARAQLQTTIASAQIALNKPKEAKAALAKAFQALPGFPPARLVEARIVGGEGDLPGALKITDEVLAGAPSFVDALLLKGQILVALGRQEEAKSAFQQAIKEKPNHLPSRMTLIALLVGTGAYDEAASQIAETGKIGRTLHLTYLEALLAYRRGDLAKARGSILQVLKVAPDHLPSMLLAGAIEYDARSYILAEDYLRKVVDRAPRAVLPRRMLAATLLRQGKVDRASELIQPLLDQPAIDAATLALAGEVQFAKGDFQQALEYLKKASALDAQNTVMQTRLAQVRLATGEVDQAVKDLESVAASDTSRYQADLILIASHLQRKELDKALAAVGSLEKKQPDNPLTYNLKGGVYLARSDFPNARAAFERALELQPAYLAAIANLVRLDLADKNLDAARKRFNAALAKSPNDSGLLVAYAEFLRGQGAPSKEVGAQLEKAVTANPTSVPATVAWIDHLNQRGDPKAALTAAQRAAAASPENPRVLELLGLAQQAAGDPNQALSTFNRLAALLPQSPGPQVRIAGAYLQAKDQSAAIEALKKAQAIQPKSLEIRRDLALLLQTAGRSAEALAIARGVEKEFPKEPAGYVLEGDLFAAQKKRPEAETAYREALGRAKSPLIMTRLLAVLDDAGKSAAADAELTKWSKDNPKDTIVYLYLADSRLARKEYKEAAVHYRAALDRQPDNPVALNNLAWVSGQLNDPAAIGYAERANQLAPASPAIMDTLGWLLVEKGETARGVELLRRAVDLAPGSAELRLHLAKGLLKAGDKSAARKELAELTKLARPTPARDEAAELLKSL